MPTHHPKLPPPPQPTKIFFDPFNSSSTGHQTAPSRLSGSTSWRQSRGFKLSHQFRDATGHGGSSHLNDLVGAGSENYKRDGRKENGDWEKHAPGLREQGWQDIRSLMQGSRKRSRTKSEEDENTKSSVLPVLNKRNKLTGSFNIGDERHVSSKENQSFASNSPKPRIEDDDQGHRCEQDTTTPPLQPPQIFRGLTIYLNGSTAPLVSDQRLKQMFAQHGGNASLALGRRTVTHVILGKGCRDGLAASKIQKEVTTVGGKGIKFVSAQWVLDSVERGIRQPEGRYQPSTISAKIGGCGQKSVAGLFTKQK